MLIFITSDCTATSLSPSAGEKKKKSAARAFNRNSLITQSKLRSLSLSISHVSRALYNDNNGGKNIPRFADKRERAVQHRSVKVWQRRSIAGNSLRISCRDISSELFNSFTLRCTVGRSSQKKTKPLKPISFFFFIFCTSEARERAVVDVVVGRSESGLALNGKSRKTNMARERARRCRKSVIGQS